MKKSSIWKKLLMVLGALVAVVAIVVASVYGTIAYLSSSALIQNSFTVGKVGITLTESPVDAKGQATTGERVTQNKYTLVADAEYDKDPTIYTSADSQPSYLFIIIRNDLSSTNFKKTGTYGTVSIVDGKTIESNTADEPSILAQVLANGWLPYTSVATGNVYVYAGKDTQGNILTAASEVEHDMTIPVFQKLYISENVSEFHQYATAQINVRAFAIQDTGFENDVVDPEGPQETPLMAVDKAWNALVKEYSNVIVGAGS